MKPYLSSRIVAALSLFGGVADALVCPQVAPTTLPAWVDIVSNSFNRAGSPGTALMFSDLQANPRTLGQSLPFTVQVPSSAIGAYDTHTFPSGPVFYSNSSGASINCLPGIDPSQPGGCPFGQVGEGCLPDGDCTGQPILRTPATGILSAFSDRIAGIDYLGTFDGTSNAAPGSILQIVFFHQSPDYLAQMEYGFYKDAAVPNQIIFYWQTNANCTLRPSMGPGDTMCTTLRGNRQPSTYLYTDGLMPPANSPGITASCSIDLGPAGGFGLYYYSMWIFSDGGTLKFGMSIVDPNTMMPVVPETSIDPNVGSSPPWYPISRLNGTGGYVTAGITRYDPFNTQTFPSMAPAMSVQRLMVGNAPPEPFRRPR